MTNNNVKERRKALGMTLRELSAASGVPISTLEDVEQGTEPGVITALRIARALTNTVEELWPI